MNYAHNEKDQIPCRICGRPTPMLGTKLCNGCYEFESNIVRVLNTASGMQYVLHKIQEVALRLLAK